jgi:hypothetical protein
VSSSNPYYSGDEDDDLFDDTSSQPKSSIAPNFNGDIPKEIPDYLEDALAEYASELGVDLAFVSGNNAPHIYSGKKTLFLTFLSKGFSELMSNPSFGIYEYDYDQMIEDVQVSSKVKERNMVASMAMNLLNINDQILACDTLLPLLFNSALDKTHSKCNADCPNRTTDIGMTKVVFKHISMRSRNVFARYNEYIDNVFLAPSAFEIYKPVFDLVREELIPLQSERFNKLEASDVDVKSLGRNLSIDHFRSFNKAVNLINEIQSTYINTEKVS